MTSRGRLLSGAAVLALGLGAQAASAKTTIIHADHVVVDPQSPVRGQSTVIVTDGKIVSIADGFTDGPAGAEMVHLAGKTLVAGLVDLHVHLNGDPSGDWWREATDTDEWGTIVAAKNARLTKAVALLYALEAGLDFDKGGSVAETLSRFYRGCRDAVMRASIESNAALVRDVIANVGEIAASWKAIGGR